MLSTMVERNNLRAVDLHLAHPLMTSQVDRDQALLVGTQLGRGEIVKSLLLAKADPNFTTRSNVHVLEVAIKSGSNDIVRMLLKFGARIHECNMPLHAAIMAGKLDIVEILVEHGCDVNGSGFHGNTALLVAMQRKMYEIAEYLLDREADVNADNASGWTALHFAAKSGVCVDMLLQFGAYPNVYNDDGNTPLLLASAEGFDNVVITLLENGADPNTYLPVNRRTPLHILSMKGHLAAVKRLLERGAKIDWRDADDMDALNHAVGHGRVATALWLIKMTAKSNCGSNSTSTCPLRVAIAAKTEIPLKTMLCIGFDASHAKVILQDPQTNEQICEILGGECCKELSERYSEPLSLKMICRHVIRENIRGGLASFDWRNIALPSPVADFLSFRELIQFVVA